MVNTLKPMQTLVEFFYHSWGSASRDAESVIAELASKYADATLLKVDMDVNALMVNMRPQNFKIF